MKLSQKDATSPSPNNSPGPLVQDSIADSLPSDAGIILSPEEKENGPCRSNSEKKNKFVIQRFGYSTPSIRQYPSFISEQSNNTNMGELNRSPTCSSRFFSSPSQRYSSTIFRSSPHNLETILRPGNNWNSGLPAVNLSNNLHSASRSVPTSILAMMQDIPTEHILTTGRALDDSSPTSSGRLMTPQGSAVVQELSERHSHSLRERDPNLATEHAVSALQSDFRGILMESSPTCNRRRLSTPRSIAATRRSPSLRGKLVDEYADSDSRRLSTDAIHARKFIDGSSSIRSCRHTTKSPIVRVQDWNGANPGIQSDPENF